MTDIRAIVLAKMWIKRWPGTRIISAEVAEIEDYDLHVMARDLPKEAREDFKRLVREYRETQK